MDCRVKIIRIPGSSSPPINPKGVTMYKKSIVFLPVLVALVFGTAILNAGDFGSKNTIVYPSENPVFSITFPDNWETETDENMLHSNPSDSSIYVGIWALEKDVKLNDALDALDETISSLVTDLKVGEAEKNIINGMEFISVDGSGKDKDGDAVNISAAVFSPDKKQVFILIYYGTPEAEKLHEAELTALLKSINED